MVDGESSDHVSFLSGVPQGSVIGTALFLLYINDLPENIKSKARLFTDDTTLYLTITNEDHRKQLQEHLGALQKWEERWKMEFNNTKCEVLRISCSRTPIPYTYYLHRLALKEVDHVNYLVIHIYEDLKWNKHIDEILRPIGRWASSRVT